MTVTQPFVLPVAGGSLQIDEGTGNNSLTLNGTAGDDTVAVTSNSVTINGNSVVYNNITNLSVNTLSGADTMTMSSINPATATTINTNVSTSFASVNCILAGH